MLGGSKAGGISGPIVGAGENGAGVAGMVGTGAGAGGAEGGCTVGIDGGGAAAGGAERTGLGGAIEAVTGEIDGGAGAAKAGGALGAGAGPAIRSRSGPNAFIAAVLGDRKPELRTELGAGTAPERSSAPVQDDAGLGGAVGVATGAGTDGMVAGVTVGGA